MRKAILEITPEDPGNYFNLETNDVNKVQIADGLRACLQALTDEIFEEAVKAVGDDYDRQQEWIHSQRTEFIKAQVSNPKMN
jgi:hypothetical protein